MGRVAKYGALALFGVVVAAAVAIVLVIRHYEARVPSVAQLRAGYEPPQVTRVVARDGTLLANLFTERRTVIPLSELPDHAKLAFLAAEDAHFYEHQGLNYIGMLRALLKNLRSGTTRQGGSTITQQVVKNVLLDAERSYERKIKEAILARRLEQNLSKDEIFALYLNHIYFGHGRYGVEEAARYYFGKKASELELDEAALLAGLVAAPERFSPRNNPKKALERRRYVLQQMHDKHFVTQQLFEKSAEAPLRLAPAVEAEAELAPEVVAYAQRLLHKVVGDRASVGGFTIHTTIDPELQARARQAVRKNLDDYGKRQKLAPPYTLERRRLWGTPFAGHPAKNHSYTGVVVSLDDEAATLDVRVGDLTGRVYLSEEERFNPQRLPPSKFASVGAAMRVHVLPPNDADPPDRRRLKLALGPQSALVLVDVRTREVRALVGSYEAIMGGLDRATRTQRQPGSSFKPFLYSYALHSRRFTPATVLELPPKAGATAKPADDESEAPEKRLLSVRRAITTSNNDAAWKLIEDVGAAHVVQWAHACGIESKLGATRSLALGSYEVTPLEIANAYVTFASGGQYAPPAIVSKIVGPDGRELALPPQPPSRRVMTPEEAYLTTSLLRSVVEHGTGRGARVLARPLAGKTGTTNDEKDAWFVGYSTDYAAAVWVGYDTPMHLGWGEQGATTALPAWVEVMKTAHEKRPAAEFPRPGKILTVNIDPATGLLPYEGQEDAVTEEFLPDTVPTEHAAPDDEAVESEVPAEEPEPSVDPLESEDLPPEPADSTGENDEPPPF
jgi:penicillin-binding protein 1A